MERTNLQFQVICFEKHSLVLICRADTRFAITAQAQKWRKVLRGIR